MKFSTLLPLIAAAPAYAVRQVQLFATSSEFLTDDIFLSGLVSVHEGAGLEFLLADYSTNYTVFNYDETNGTLTRPTSITFGEGDVRVMEWPLTVFNSYGEGSFPYLAVSTAPNENDEWSIDEKGFLTYGDGEAGFYLAQNTSDPYSLTNNDKWAIAVANETAVPGFQGKVQNLRKAGIYVRDVYHFP